MNCDDRKVINDKVDGFNVEISANCMVSVYADSLLEKVTPISLPINMKYNFQIVRLL